MKFAKIVFFTAGAWGVVVITPFYFLFDAIGRQHASPITFPQFYYGFLAVSMAWQAAFFVIGTAPLRFRLLMIPAMVEKFYYVLTMAVLFAQGRVGVADVVTISPDLVLGALFVVAFAKVSSSPERRKAHQGWRAATGMLET